MTIELHPTVTKLLMECKKAASSEVSNFLRTFRTHLSAVDSAFITGRRMKMPEGKIILNAEQVGDEADPYAWSAPPGVMEITCVKFPGMWSLTGGGFTTAMCNVALMKGKWMYEVVLGSDGLQQIGWSLPPALVPCCHRAGVGDFPFTYGYDGFRQCLWNVSSEACGPRWSTGDVVSCLLDLDTGIMRFLLNGAEVITKKLPRMEDYESVSFPVVYVPAISFAQNEGCIVNIGACPFLYPQEGFHPIDDTSAEVSRWKGRMATLSAILAEPKFQDFLIPMMNCILDRISTSDHVTAFSWALQPYLSSWVQHGQLKKMAALMEVSISAKLRETTWGATIANLCFKSSVRMMSPVSPSPSPELQLLKELLEIPQIRVDWVCSTSFLIDMLNVFRIKVPNNHDMETSVFPTIPLTSSSHMEGGAVNDELKELTDNISSMYNGCIMPDDEARKVILGQLLGDKRTGSKVHDFLDVVIRDLRDRPRATSIPIRRHSPLGVDSALATRLFLATSAHVVRTLPKKMSVEEMVLRFCPEKILAASAIERLEVQRVGGQFHHLQRVHAAALANCADIPSRYDPLLLKATILHVIGAKPKILEACEAIVHRGRSQDALQAMTEDDVDALIAEVGKAVRCCAWDSATLFYVKDQESLMEICSVLAEILKVYHQTPLFHFLPVFMIECFVDILHLCRRTSPNFVPILEKYPQCVTLLFEFYLDHSIEQDTNEYIMNALAGLIDSYEPHRQAVANILDKHPSLVNKFLASLLNHFGHRIGWTLVVGTLARFNLGSCFCFTEADDELINYASIFPHLKRRKLAPEAYKFYAAALLRYFQGKEWMKIQGLSADVLAGSTYTKFLQNLLDHTNFSITELGAALHVIQVQQGTRAGDQHEISLQRRRCSSLFDLTKNLLRVIEFIIEVGREKLFVKANHKASSPTSTSTADLDDGSSLHPNLIAEVIGQCLARFGTASNPLTVVSAMGIKGLERIRPAKLLAPVIGCLYNMTNAGKDLDWHANLFLSCMATPGIQWSYDQVVYTFSAFDWAALEQTAGNEVKKSSFAKNPAVLKCFEECHQVRMKVISDSKYDGTTGDIDEGTCLICAFSPVDTVFEPCQHTSCNACVRRHLLNSEKCFFCNKKIESLLAVEPVVGSPA